MDALCYAKELNKTNDKAFLIRLFILFLLYANLRVSQSLANPWSSLFQWVSENLPIAIPPVLLSPGRWEQPPRRANRIKIQKLSSKIIKGIKIGKVIFCCHQLAIELTADPVCMGGKSCQYTTIFQDRNIQLLYWHDILPIQTGSAVSAMAS